MSDFERELKRLRKDIYIIYFILFLLGLTNYLWMERLEAERKTGFVVEPKVEVEILEKK